MLCDLIGDRGIVFGGGVFGDVVGDSGLVGLIVVVGGLWGVFDVLCFVELGGGWLLKICCINLLCELKV